MKSIRKKWKQGKYQKIQNAFTRPAGEETKNNEDEEEDIEDQDSQTSSQSNLSLLQRLQSSDGKIKELALIALASISYSSGQHIIEACVQQDVLLQLSQTLEDSSPMIVIHALNSITNLLGLEYYARENNHLEIGVSGYLLEKSLLVKLEKLLMVVKGHLQLQTISHDDRIASLKILHTLFELLTCLCENVQERYLKLVTDSPIAAVFTNTAVELLSSAQDLELLSAVLSYLQVVTECSGVCCVQMIENNELMEIFARILHSNNLDDLKFKSQVVSILYNVLTTCENRLNPEFEVVLTTMCEYIMSTMSIKIFQEVYNLKSIMSNNLSGLIQQIENDEKNMEQAENQGDDQDNERENNNAGKTHQEDEKSKEATRIWFSTAEAIECVMSVLVNLFEKENEADVFEDEEMNSDCDEDIEENKLKQQQTNMESVKVSSSGLVENQVKIFMISKLSTMQFLEMIKEKSVIVGSELIGFFDKYGESGQAVLAQMNSLINLALSLLTNWIYNNKTQLLFEWCSEAIRAIWSDFKNKLVALQSSSQLNSILIVNLKLILLILQQNEGLQVQILPADLLSIQNDLLAVNSQELTLVFLDVVALRFSATKKLENTETNSVCQLLKGLLMNDDPMVASQSLNTLFDVFSEEDRDDVFVANGMLMILSEGKDLFQNKITQLKSSMDKQDYDFVKQTLVNLKRFIKYKQAHIPQK